ncbi:MAG: tRNA (adenosine(37)-N6)-threonylcarbamoyltransferase complex ATPase subunit type 1 TsaE [Flavonifractor plautii]
MFHFDMYRLGDPEELFDIGWEDYLARGGVCAVEWSENVADALEDRTPSGWTSAGEQDEQADSRTHHWDPDRRSSNAGKGRIASMKILALESSATACSAALCEDEDPHCPGLPKQRPDPQPHPAAHGRSTC